MDDRSEIIKQFANLYLQDGNDNDYVPTKKLNELWNEFLDKQTLDLNISRRNIFHKEWKDLNYRHDRRTKGGVKEMMLTGVKLKYNPSEPHTQQTPELFQSHNLCP